MLRTDRNREKGEWRTMSTMHTPSPSPDSVMEDPRAPEILAIVAKETGIDRALLRPEASIEALGIPSLDMVQTIFELESQFDIEIPVVSERSGAEFVTVADLVAHVLASMDKARAAQHAAANLAAN